MTGVAMNTVLKLLAELGHACASYHNAHVRRVKAQRIQCDEIWQFVGAKAKNVTPEQKAQGWGDVWTWTAIDADSKLIISWFVGSRDPYSARWFMRDVRSRIVTRPQLTTDGHAAYLAAVESAFRNETTFDADVYFAQLVKVYGNPREGAVRYSPGNMIGTQRTVITGEPDPAHISTSYVERQNLSMRMGMRRFTRLTNAFSKKTENHAHAIALYFIHYNFVRVHKTLRVTPAMEAGLANRVWSLEDVISLLDTSSAAAA
jgi:IS1 family transposase